MAEWSNRKKRVEPSSQVRAKLNILQIVGHRIEEDLLESGLTSILTMFTAFVQLVYYMTYRLPNQQWELSRGGWMEMYLLKQRVNVLDPTLDHFYGSEPVIILSFLSTIRDACDT